MSGFSVRDYTLDDYSDVQNIWTQTNLGGMERGDNSDTITRSLSLGGKLIILVDNSNNEVIGTSWLTFDGRRLHLHHFGILPYYQGKGLSKLLLDASMEIVKELGHQVKLEVHSSNIKAINLYTRNGFKSLGNYDVYIIRDVDEINGQRT